MGRIHNCKSQNFTKIKHRKEKDMNDHYGKNAIKMKKRASDRKSIPTYVNL